MGVHVSTPLVWVEDGVGWLLLELCFGNSIHRKQNLSLVVLAAAEERSEAQENG